MGSAKKIRFSTWLGIACAIFAVLVVALYPYRAQAQATAVTTIQLRTPGFHSIPMSWNPNTSPMVLLLQDIPPGDAVNVSFQNTTGSTLTFAVTGVFAAMNPNATYQSINVSQTDATVAQACTFYLPPASGPPTPTYATASGNFSLGNLSSLALSCQPAQSQGGALQMSLFCSGCGSSVSINATTWVYPGQLNSGLVFSPFTYAHISTSGCTNLTGIGYLGAVQINNPGTSWSFEIFAGTACSGPVIANSSSVSAGQVYQYYMQAGSPISIQTSGAAGDLTVSYR